MTTGNTLHNFLTPKVVELFILANIFCVTYNKMVNVAYEKINVFVEETPRIAKMDSRYTIFITTSDKNKPQYPKNDEEEISVAFSMYATSETEHMKMLIEATMKVLDALAAKYPKPVLKVVK